MYIIDTPLGQYNLAMPYLDAEDEQEDANIPDIYLRTRLNPKSYEFDAWLAKIGRRIERMSLPQLKAYADFMRQRFFINGRIS